MKRKEKYRKNKEKTNISITSDECDKILAKMKKYNTRNKSLEKQFRKQEESEQTEGKPEYVTVTINSEITDSTPRIIDECKVFRQRIKETAKVVETQQYQIEKDKKGKNFAQRKYNEMLENKRKEELLKTIAKMQENEFGEK